MLSWLNYKETQRANNNSYFRATKECFLFTTHWIIPDRSRCGNHPHCPEIVSSAPASSPKNIYFTAKMLEYELTMTLTPPLLPNVLSLYRIWGSQKTIHPDVDRLLKTSHYFQLPLAPFHFPAGSIHLNMFPWTVKCCFSTLSFAAMLSFFPTQLQICKNYLFLKDEKNIRKNHIFSALQTTCARKIEWNESK